MFLLISDDGMSTELSTLITACTTAQIGRTFPLETDKLKLAPDTDRSRIRSFEATLN